MIDFSLLWVPVTLVAAAAQTVRNATQRSLTERIGTVGATQVRFLYGLPFAGLFLGLVLVTTGERLPRPDGAFAPYIAAAAVSQIGATALMLAAMRRRSFAVVTATIKTEPVLVALFGLIVLGDRLGWAGAAAVIIATIGVVLASTRAGTSLREGAQPILLGLAAGALFALAAVSFRGAILALDEGSFLIRATTTLVWGLGLQSAILALWLGLLDRRALMASLKAWRPSLAAGFLGALASQFWFLGFALTSAANVRTLALVEVLMAQALSRRLTGQRASRREIVGMGLIVVGVGLLLASQR
jgi:drug/metabolite transporter (DMT)-like permease